MLTIIITSLFLLMDIACLVLGFIFAINPIAIALIFVVAVMMGSCLFMFDIPAYQAKRAVKRQLKKREMEEYLMNFVELAKIAGKLEYMREQLDKEDAN